MASTSFPRQRSWGMKRPASSSRSGHWFTNSSPATTLSRACPCSADNATTALRDAPICAPPARCELGAPHTINGATKDPVKTIVDMTNGGVDYAFEAIGLKTAAEQAFQSLRAGGTATIVGMIPLGQKIELDGSVFLREKKIQGSNM